MKSKSVFILIGGFAAAGAILFSFGVGAEIIILLSGLAALVPGMVLLAREIDWRKNSSVVPAKVTRYYEYQNPGKTEYILIYTMEAEYTTSSGKFIKAREQRWTNSKKHAIGDDIQVRYSNESPDKFIIKGDNSRIHAMLAVMALGLAVAALLTYILIHGILIEQ